MSLDMVFMVDTTQGILCTIFLTLMFFLEISLTKHQSFVTKLYIQVCTHMWIYSYKNYIVRFDIDFFTLLQELLIYIITLIRYITFKIVFIPIKRSLSETVISDTCTLLQFSII